MTDDDQTKRRDANLLAATASDGEYRDHAAPVSLQPGRRVEIEFYCSSCGHYFYFKLNTGLEGNHVINCPVCHHKHYRFVHKGVITSDRWNDSGALADEITPVKSAASKTRRQRSQIAIIQEMAACGLLK